MLAAARRAEWCGTHELREKIDAVCQVVEGKAGYGLEGARVAVLIAGHGERVAAGCRRWWR